MGKKEYWINKYGEVKTGKLYQRAHNIYNNILSAADRRIGVEPALYIIRHEGAPWAQSLADGSIILTNNALKFCYESRSPENGDSRLAFVIGHEMAHQFNGDFWHYKFLNTRAGDKDSSLAFQDIRELAKNPDLLLSKELQADQYGIIYATLAGYKSAEIISEDENFFLDWSRQSNPDLNASSVMGPLSEKRLMSVRMRLKEVSDRIVLFKMGVMDYYIGQLEDAISLLGRYASYFPGREVYSNLGSIYLRQAYEQFLQSRTPESFPFALAFGIDTKTRAETIPVARGYSEEKYREYKKLLTPAIEDLKKAVEYDPFYSEAKNSLGCAYIIDNRYYDAVAVLEDALKLSPENRKIRNNVAVVYIMLGLELGSEAMLEKAETILAAAKEADRMAAINLKALNRMLQKNMDPALGAAPSRDEQPDVSIEFPGSMKIKPSSVITKDNNYELVEEISLTKKETLKVFKVRKAQIFLLAKNNRIRLVYYKDPPEIKTDIKDIRNSGVYISGAGRNGVVVSKNGITDYFDF
ncbi:MAG: hypothetical protein ABSB95_07220 [Dissulfurispiraceae bacterium]